MDSTPAAIIAATITILIVIVAVYVWYNFAGWKTFTYKTGDDPSWIPSTGADISQLRFKNCMFTVKRSDGKIRSLDVSVVLNSMAVGFKGGTNNPATLLLTRPLNPFSFVIVGFNDRRTVTDPTVLPWCTSPPIACTGDNQCPYGNAGACSPAQTCTTCPGGATVSLVGSVRTV